MLCQLERDTRASVCCLQNKHRIQNKQCEIVNPLIKCVVLTIDGLGDIIGEQLSGEKLSVILKN